MEQHSLVGPYYVIGSYALQAQTTKEWNVNVFKYRFTTNLSKSCSDTLEKFLKFVISKHVKRTKDYIYMVKF